MSGIGGDGLGIGEGAKDFERGAKIRGVEERCCVVLRQPGAEPDMA